MRLFDTGKVPVFLDTYSPSTEKRKGGEVEILVLTLRIQPFTSQLAASMDQKVRAALFLLGGNAEPKKEIDAVSFALPFERQILTIFASSDTVQPSLALDQVKVQSVRVRTERGIDGYGCVLKVALGPVGKNELEYINAWYKTQRAVTFELAEPDLDYDEPQPEKKKPVEATATLPGLDAEAGQDAELVGVGVDRQQHTPLSHSRGKKTKRVH